VPALRIATWNCQHGKPHPEKVGASVASLDVDVVAMQEVDRRTDRIKGRDLAEDAAEAFGGELLWASALRYQGGDYGNALLVKGTVRRFDVLDLPGRRRREPRSAGVAEVVVGGRAWTIGATHLTTDRAISTSQLLALLDELATRPGPRLLVGDLNLEPVRLLPWLTAEGYRMALGPLTHSVRRPRRQIDHIAVIGRGCSITSVRSVALPVGDHLALVAGITCGGSG
jgi:endonuclease/exonuclease/phosphatase family metal-dependent hydrolase